MESWDEFMELRRPAGFRVVRRPDGLFDVALVVDGGYVSKRDAERIAEFLASELPTTERRV